MRQIALVCVVGLLVRFAGSGSLPLGLGLGWFAGVYHTLAGGGGL